MSLINDSIGVKRINIRFTTNNNPSSETVLTRDLIDIPDEESKEESKEDDLSNYPFFTDTALIPKVTLSSLSRKEQIKFFFNKDVFFSIIPSVTNANDKERNANAETNLETLLNILLPTSFPIVNNISNTFSENILNVVPLPKIQDFNFFEMLSIKPNKYGYITLNGSIFTVSKITLVNDIINDTIFSILIRSGKKFQSWRQSIIKGIQNNINSLDLDLNNILTSKMPGIQQALLSGISESTLEAQKGVNPDPLAQAFRNMKDPRSAQNKTNIQLLELFEPLEELSSIDLENPENIHKILSSFDSINKLVKSSTKSEEYIPLTIRGIPGFSELLVKSKNLKIYKFKLDYLTDLSKLNPYLNDKGGKLKDISDFMLKEAIEDLIRYSQINAFLKEVSNYKPPKRNYTNNLLRDILINVIKDLETFLKFIEFVNDISVEGVVPTSEQLNDSSKDILKTGVMSVYESTDSKEGNEDILGINNKIHYDSCIHLELIKGRLDDDSVESVRCPYRDQLLNKAYDEIMPNKNKNPVLLYKRTELFSMSQNPATRKQPTTGGKKSNCKTVKKRQSRRQSRRQKGGFPRQMQTLFKIKEKKGKKGKKGKKHLKTLSNSPILTI